MLERGLQPDFSDAALKQLDAIAHAVPAHADSLRDLRELLWASIDNDDSRDLDQLSVAEALPGDAVKIFVAIADVDALVKQGSAIDGHAQTNTTSVYTAAQVFPMLPEKLSTDLTSLGEGVDRLAIVVEMVVKPDGAVADSDVYRAIVRNRAKLAYNGVAAWLDGTAPAPARVLRRRGDRRAAPHPGPRRPAAPAAALRARRAHSRDARGASRLRRRRALGSRARGAQPREGPHRRLHDRARTA